MITGESANRWAPRPAVAWMIRAVVFVLPLAGSVVFVRIASSVVPVQTGSFAIFVCWWLGMSGAATVVLVAIERGARRALPLVALFRLSLVFPDAAPSRFRAAMASNTVESLEQRVAGARAGAEGSTPVEAAQRLLALVRELDAHDRLTRGHAERVRAYAQLIGQELRLTADELDSLNWAALLHDVGKLGIPPEILRKEGRPTEDEWEVLRRHPSMGEELIAPLREWLGEWSQAVSHHHERWDGQGYPHGVPADEIGLAARIVAVADTFDVITSARSYKSAFASSDARDEIARCAGTQFDPRVVRAFLGISLGRLRLVMGPLSWLTHVPILGRLPLTPAIGTVTASIGTVVAALTAGVVATPPAAVYASTVPHVLVQTIERSIQEDESTVVDVSEGLDGASVIALETTRQPEVGRAVQVTRHRLRYTPPPNFNGEVSIGYKSCWAGRGCHDGTVSIVILPVNDPPVARDDRTRVASGRTVSIDVLGNDTDPDGDPLSIVRVSSSRAGRAVVADGRIRWTAEPGFAGKARFLYTASDGQGGGATAAVTVDVSRRAAAPAPAVLEEPPVLTPVPLPPSPPPPPSPSAPPPPPPAVNRAPVAGADGFSIPEGGTVVVDVLANDSDPDGDALSIVAVGTPARGSARRVGDRVEFTAPVDFDGEVTFPYTIADPRGAMDSATITVNVLPVNNAPSFTVGSARTVLEDSSPQTVPRFVTGIAAGPANESSQVVSFLVASDNAGLFSVQPTVGADGTLRFTSAGDANGSATVTVRARDDGGTANGGVDTSAPQTFVIVVTPVNDPPIAKNDSATAEQDDPAGVTVNVFLNDSDVDSGDLLILSSYDSSAIVDGTLLSNGNGSFTYVPNPGFVGTETFTYVIADGFGATASASVTIFVTAVPHAPIAGSDSYSTQVDTPLAVAADGVLGNDGDQDGDTITLLTTPVAAPLNGSVSLAADGSFTYTPSLGFIGTDTFAYRITDGTGRADDGTVTITVTASPTLLSTLYFQSSGPTADIWNMSLALPPSAPQLQDFDGDAKPGLTIKASQGAETESVGARYQTWTYTAPSPLVLNGPISLDLWSSTGFFANTKQGTVYTYLYDCAGGGFSCTMFAANTAFEDPWNISVSDWTNRVIMLGSVTRTIPAGNELRIKVLFRPSDLWLTMSAAYPTALIVSLG